ncbi:unnamed protein product [Triticum turgidum subsp. durum]|uniref:Cellulose synthase n=1 Tax=Triticum turgidum subsp. durum TaxID=4567 RepID=A0A9R0SMH0_TRITD|nr:unnamed protein product [Triticum turgidum subsp. durum]
MEASAGLVAGSHNRNELVVIRRDGGRRGRSSSRTAGRARFAGTTSGSAPAATPSSPATSAPSPSAATATSTSAARARRTARSARPATSCARVPGDEEEDGADDLEDEFNWRDRDDSQYAAESMLHAHMTYGRGGDLDGVHQPFQPNPNVPLLTNGQMVDDIPPEQHALVPSFVGGGGKRIHPLPYADSNCNRDPWTHPRILVPTGTVASPGRRGWRAGSRSRRGCIRPEMMAVKTGTGMATMQICHCMDEARQPLSRKVPIPSSLINPYRMIIVIRLVIVCLFFHYRVMHPVHDAFVLWLISVICEIWFAMSWILDQFPKWFPIERETYLDRLTLRVRQGRPAISTRPS